MVGKFIALQTKQQSTWVPKDFQGNNKQQRDSMSLLISLAAENLSKKSSLEEPVHVTAMKLVHVNKTILVSSLKSNKNLNALINLLSISSHPPALEGALCPSKVLQLYTATQRQQIQQPTSTVRNKLVGIIYIFAERYYPMDCKSIRATLAKKADSQQLIDSLSGPGALRRIMDELKAQCVFDPPQYVPVDSLKAAAEERTMEEEGQTASGENLGSYFIQITGIPAAIDIDQKVPSTISTNGTIVANQDSIHLLLIRGRYKIGDDIVDSPFESVEQSLVGDTVNLKLIGSDRSTMMKITLPNCSA